MASKNAKEKFLRLERLGEYFTYATVLIGVAIVQLPFPFAINRWAVDLIALATALFSIVWHRFTPKDFSGKTKNFIEAIVDVFAISLVVHFTGGINSYFMFLYFLPTLNIAANMELPYTLGLLGLTYSFILLQGIGEANGGGGVGALSVAVFHLWAQGLVVAYGRLLSNEVSAAKQKEEETKVEQIEEVSKIKDEFVFIISHELRSPITAIRGYLELLSDSSKKVNSNLNSLLAKAFYTANKLANLVSLLLEVSRLETGKIKFYVQKTKLKEAVDATLSEISIDAQTKHISLTSDVGENDEVLIDPERLVEILTILIENAVRYTPEYGRVEIAAAHSLAGIDVKISDTGIGIAPGLIEHLFEKFYKIKAGDGKELKGTGFGLYVCKNLLKAMRGDISVESKLGKGSTFTIHLPISA